MSVPWNSLKLRLAITVALLMGLGVAVTVVLAVRETQQRALSAAAGDWPAGVAAQSAQADALLARQSVLRALFDRVLLVSGSDLPGAMAGAPSVSPPLRGFEAAGAPDIVLAVPVSAGAPLLLAGTLSLKSTNFLSNATRPESLAEAELQTIVADQQGRVLAHPDPSRLLGRIDLDHFKQVNDNAGHGAGDALLERIAQVLQQPVRSEDTVSHLGGDEFAVLLPACGLDWGMQIAEAIRAQVQASGKVEGAPQGVTASIGVVKIAGAHATLASVMESADRACYAAKRAGRNAVRAACDESLLVAAGP